MDAAAELVTLTSVTTEVRWQGEGLTLMIMAPIRARPIVERHS
jgi:hypothetical protein